MRVFAVCPLCDDYYYGFSSPEVVTDSLETAIQYAKDSNKHDESDKELTYHQDERSNGTIEVWYGKYNDIAKHDLSYGTVYGIIPFDLI